LNKYTEFTEALATGQTVCSYKYCSREANWDITRVSSKYCLTNLGKFNTGRKGLGNSDYVRICRSLMWFCHGFPQGVLHQESPLPTIWVNIPNAHGPKVRQGCERDTQLFEHISLILVPTSQKTHLLAIFSISTVDVLVATWTSATTIVGCIIVGLATELEAFCKCAFFGIACRTQRVTGQPGPSWHYYPHHLLDEASCKNQAEQNSESFHSGALKFPLSEARVLPCATYVCFWSLWVWSMTCWVHHFHLVLFL